MAGKSPPSAKTDPAQKRDQRLKAALKANLARRKAQTKVRSLAGSGGSDNKTGKNEE
jgi:hypothetical protein